MSKLTRTDVLEQYKQECSFLLHGACSTLGCLRRGGYEGHGTEGITPTCAAREAVEAALPPAMTWTREKPVKPGYYWFKGVYRASGIGAGEHQIMWLNKYGTAFAMYGTQLDVKELDGEWAGPMEPPQ